MSTPLPCRAVIGSVVLLAGVAAAQVDRGVWIVTTTAAHEIRRDGTPAASYPLPCFAVVTGCAVTVARDGQGNVYAGRITYFAPGVGGSLTVLRGGTGVVTTVSAAPTSVIVDGADTVWYVNANYSSSAQTVTSITVRRMSAGLANVLGAFTLPQTYGLLASHPVDGVWLAAGSTVSRISGAVAVTATLTLPAAAIAIAADRLGRLWVVAGTTLHLLTETPGGSLLNLWSAPVGGGIESIHVDACGFVHVHQNASTSSVLRFAPDGTALPAVAYSARFLAMNPGTGGGYWFEYADASSGVNVLSFDGVTATAAFLEPLTIPGGLYLLPCRGDWTGNTFCAQLFPGADSDGDLSPNVEEAGRGTDMLRPLSRPPSLTMSPVSGSSWTTWRLDYADPDPAHAGLVYQLGCSLGTAAGLYLGGGGTCPHLPLDFDAVLGLSLSAGPPVFTAFGGALDPQGGATAFLSFPPSLPPGIPFFLAGVTFHSAAGLFVATSAATPALTP